MYPLLKSYIRKKRTKKKKRNGIEGKTFFRRKNQRKKTKSVNYVVIFIFVMAVCVCVSVFFSFFV
jgi:hypothetical protein